MTEEHLRQATEAEIVIYQELADFLDKYARQLLHSREHEQAARNMAIALEPWLGESSAQVAEHVRQNAEVRKNERRGRL